MSSRTSTALPSVAAHGDEVTRDGVVYRYNTTPPGLAGTTGTARWETVLDKNLTIVTKDTTQLYFTTQATQSQSVSKKDALLNIPEIDANFVNLKKSVLALERELIGDGGVLQRINENSQNFGNTSGTVSNLQATLAPLRAPALLNSADGLSVPSAPTPSLTGGHQSDGTIATTRFVNDILGSLPGDIKPAGSTNSLGSQNQPFQTLFVSQDIVPTSTTGSSFQVDFNGTPQQVNETNVNLGSPTAAFNNIYAKSGFFADNSISIGDARLSQSTSGGIILPQGSSIGTDDNEIPATFASTLIDERFAQISNPSDTLSSEFQVSGTINALDPVRINTDGTVASILSNTGSTEGFIGLALTSGNTSSPASILLHGIINGFTGLTPNTNVFIETSGALVQTKTSTTKKIGRALSATSIFLFTSSSLDIYLLNKVKISLNDLSVRTQGASGVGSLTYTDSSGVFTYTPPDLSSLATQTYVTTQINNLVDSAPGTLNTLNELAAALGDDANFSTSVTNNLALKATIESPTFTGSPKAPTPAASSNDTSLATTAFVKTQGGVSSLDALTNVTISGIQDGQVLAFDSASSTFKNANQSGGGGSSIDFLVDGGGANVAAASVIIVLDGGGA